MNNFDKAITIMTKAYGENHHELGELFNNYGLLYC